jgi:hypothetical protein
MSRHSFVLLTSELWLTSVLFAWKGGKAEIGRVTEDSPGKKVCLWLVMEALSIPATVRSMKIAVQAGTGKNLESNLRNNQKKD